MHPKRAKKKVMHLLFRSHYFNFLKFWLASEQFVSEHDKCTKTKREQKGGRSKKGKAFFFLQQILWWQFSCQL